MITLIVSITQLQKFEEIYKRGCLKFMKRISTTFELEEYRLWNRLRLLLINDL